jgi:hypothetical protein
MRTLAAVGLFFVASVATAAPFCDIPEKKQKNPGRAAAPPAGDPTVRKDQSHDVHELEKISFTVIGEAAQPTPGSVYLKIRADSDSDGDGLGDESVMRVVCAGGEVREAAIWFLGTQGSDARAPTFVKEWGPSTPQFRALSQSYVKRKLHRASAGAQSSGWTDVDLSPSFPCPAADKNRADYGQHLPDKRR